MFSIELSVNAVKGSNIGINEIIKQLGIDLNCLSYAYYDDVVYDKSKKCNIQMIHQISFSKRARDNFILFINSVKKYKEIYIDCVYTMLHNNCKILFASKFYCKNNMNKQGRKSYLENETFTEEENIILNALSIKK